MRQPLHWWTRISFHPVKEPAHAFAELIFELKWHLIWLRWLCFSSGLTMSDLAVEIHSPVAYCICKNLGFFQSHFISLETCSSTKFFFGENKAQPVSKNKNGTEPGRGHRKLTTELNSPIKKKSHTEPRWANTASPSRFGQLWLTRFNISHLSVNTFVFCCFYASPVRGTKK